jgi:hypothetical protein
VPITNKCLPANETGVDPIHLIGKRFRRTPTDKPKVGSPLYSNRAGINRSLSASFNSAVREEQGIYHSGRQGTRLEKIKENYKDESEEIREQMSRVTQRGGFGSSANPVPHKVS